MLIRPYQRAIWFVQVGLSAVNKMVTIDQSQRSSQRTVVSLLIVPFVLGWI
jgi:hypothetical protein